VGLDLLTVETSRSYSRHTTLGRTPLDEGSDCRTDLYLKTYNKHPCPRWESNLQSQQKKSLQACTLYRAANVTGEAEALDHDNRNFGTTINSVGAVVVGFHAQIYHCHKHAWFSFLKRVTGSGIINKNNFYPQTRGAGMGQSVQLLGHGLTIAAWVKGPLTSKMALGPPTPGSTRLSRCLVSY